MMCALHVCFTMHNPASSLTGEDFRLTGPLLFIPGGSLTATVQFAAVADGVKESNETFPLSLEITDTGGVDVAAGVMGTTQVTIIDPTCECVMARVHTYCVTVIQYISVYTLL